VVLELTAPEPPAPFDEFVGAVCAEMVKLGITGAEAMAKAAQRIVEAHAQSKPLSGIVIAEGVPPGPSQDGTIDWPEDFFKKGFFITHIVIPCFSPDIINNHL